MLLKHFLYCLFVWISSHSDLVKSLSKDEVVLISKAKNLGYMVFEVKELSLVKHYSTVKLLRLRAVRVQIAQKVIHLIYYDVLIFISLVEVIY